MKEVIFKLPDEVLALIIHKVANAPQEASLLEKWIYDGKERKTGRWKAKGFHTCYCTNCNFAFDIMKCDFMDKMRFCPTCGAKMEADK